MPVRRRAREAAAQQAIGEGAEIIVGPCSRSRSSAVSGLARQRGIPVIAFSDRCQRRRARGVYLLSFLPESDVRRIVEYAVSRRQALVRGAAAGQCLRARWKRRFSRKWRSAAPRHRAGKISG